MEVSSFPFCITVEKLSQGMGNAGKDKFMYEADKLSFRELKIDKHQRDQADQRQNPGDNVADDCQQEFFPFSLFNHLVFRHDADHENYQ